MRGMRFSAALECIDLLHLGIEYVGFSELSLIEKELEKTGLSYKE
jgi:hypothetical protein